MPPRTVVLITLATAMTATVVGLAFRGNPEAVPSSSIVKTTQTITLAQMPFSNPDWVPDEATKRKALMRAYQINGNSMVGGVMIDVSKEDLTEHVTADAPARATVEIADPNSRNVLDAQADMPVKGNETKPKTDVCKRHGLHKVIYGDRWRCRK